MKQKKLKRWTTRQLTETAVFAALTAVFSQLTVPLPFSPVPVSLSLFAVFACGAVLELREAVSAQVVYVLLGTVGAPVFSGFSGGLLRPSGGYLLTYPLIALIIGLGAKLGARLDRRRASSPGGADGAGRRPAARALLTGAAVLPALAVCYLGGCLWFAAFTGRSVASAAALTVTPFVPFDLVKGIAAAAVAVPVRRAVWKLAHAV